ncbi:MAG: MazG nucleotide pyrophosphohydrolase domain-containing protein [Candidatus Kariarchaeaceae archaeon]|jgi:NTP pyrophosphatase (non-canonical NTP hydrolase)
MELNELAIKVNDFIQTQGGYWEPAWMLAALTEELGELSRSLQVFHSVRDKSTSQRSEVTLSNVEEECGDIIFALLCLTNSFNINLEKTLLNSLEKFKLRNSVL